MTHFYTAKRSLSFLALLLFIAGMASMAFAQATASGPSMRVGADLTIGEVFGTIVEDASGEALVAASVGVRNASDSTLVTGAATMADGTFMIDSLRPGDYFAEISFIGFETWTTPTFTITEENRRVEIGIIRLAYDDTVLDGVEVTAERAAVAFEIDRTVYNTKSQITTSGGSATDVLQNVPSIEVDVDGNVSLRGNQNVSILINGKPSPLAGDFLTSFLQQIPASSVDRVEVIPNPSAKYDPDGQAGAINIVLKKEAELGTAGGLTLGAGSDGQYNFSSNISAQTGKLTFFVNYGFRNSDRNSEGYNFRENRFLDPLSFVEQDNTGLRQSISHLLNTSADYKISDRSELSASAILSTRGGDNRSLNQYSQLGSVRDLTGLSARESLASNDGLTMDYSVSFRRVVEASKNELSAEVRYSRSRGENIDDLEERLLGLDGTLVDLTPERLTNELDNLDNEWTVQADYVRTVGGLKFETGVKGSLRQMDNRFLVASFDYDSDAFVTDLNVSNSFLFDEQVGAGYGIVSGGIGKFEAQAGVRAEKAMTDFNLKTTEEVFDNDYFSLFPSAFLAYSLTPTRQLKISYSKRIRRPRTSQLNPFTTFSDPLNLRVGNPRLQPEYVHALELSFQQFSNLGSISITPYYRRTVDNIQRYKTIDAVGVSTLTFRNFDKSESYGAEVIGSVRLGRKLSGFASFNAYKIVTDASNVDANLANDAVSWSSRASATWNIRTGTDLQLFYFYRAPIDVAQGKISSFSVANVSVRQKLLQDRASLTLKVSDPLDQMGFRFEVDEAAFYQLGSRKWESRSVSLAFTYNFGKPPKRQQRNTNEGEGGFDDFGIN